MTFQVKEATGKQFSEIMLSSVIAGIVLTACLFTALGFMLQKHVYRHRDKKQMLHMTHELSRQNKAKALNELQQSPDEYETIHYEPPHEEPSLMLPPRSPPNPKERVACYDYSQHIFRTTSSGQSDEGEGSNSSSSLNIVHVYAEFKSQDDMEEMNNVYESVAGD